MYKLMLVEDEYLVRESMIQNIDWEQYGFRLVCACENGQEAVEQLPLQLPDVVVTDICMPLVDGLELARFLQEHYPSVFVVILTGFNEFSYAQQAVKLRVHDFVLKPVVPKEFCGILTKLAGELAARDTQRSSIQSLRSRANQAETMLKNDMFRRLLRGSMTNDELCQLAQAAGIRLDSPVYSAVMGVSRHMDQTVTESQRLQDAAQETASRFPNCTGALVEDRYAVLLLGGRTQDEVSRRARDAGSMLADAMGRAGGSPALVGIGSCCRDLDGLHRCFREAHHALGYGFTTGHRVISDQAAAAAERADTVSELLPGERDLLDAMQIHDEEEAQRQLERLFDSMISRGLHWSVCFPILERLRFALTDLIPEEDRGAAPQVSLTDNWTSAETIRQAFSQLIAFIQRKTSPSDADAAQRFAESAKGYILQRFHDSEFSLTELLSLLNVSKSYFSATFKAQTGQTFVEYLTGVRMEKAKYLLTHTDLCTYEIAERVGFTDPHYFSVTFKRNVGKTPRNYREDPQ